jgi:hypothetical protein
LIRVIIRIAINECPPRSKKSSSSRTDSTPRRSDQIAISTASIVAPEAAWQPFVEIASVAGGSLQIDPTLTRVLAVSGWLFALVVQAWVTRNWLTRNWFTRIRLTKIGVVGRRTTGPQVLEQWGVLAIAWVLGLLVDPLLAVGLYFLLIHATGHCLRADARERRVATPGAANAIKMHLWSAPLTIPSVGIVLIIALAMFGAVTLPTVALAFLLFCVVGTLPHHLLWLGAYGPLPSDPSAR